MGRLLPTVFVSYRRDDAAGSAGRVYDRLVREFGPDNVFIDVDKVRPGEDFVDAIARKLRDCDVMLVVIGRSWLQSTDSEGRRRLDDELDYHRIEVQTALERGIATVPVLVERATMPRFQDLPEVLQRLARRQAAEVRETRWHDDMGILVETLKGLPARPTEHVSDTAFKHNPKRHENESPQFHRPTIKAIIGGATVALLAILLVWLAYSAGVTPREADADISAGTSALARSEMDIPLPDDRPHTVTGGNTPPPEPARGKTQPSNGRPQQLNRKAARRGNEVPNVASDESGIEIVLHQIDWSASKDPSYAYQVQYTYRVSNPFNRAGECKMTTACVLMHTDTKQILARYESRDDNVSVNAASAVLVPGTLKCAGYNEPERRIALVLQMLSRTCVRK